MKTNKLVPFGTQTVENKKCINFVFVAFVATTTLSDTYKESGSKVPNVLMKQRFDGSIGFIGGFHSMSDNSLIDTARRNIYEETGLIIGAEDDKFIPVSTHLVTDDESNYDSLHHLYYIKVKEESIKNIMMSLIQSKSFRDSQYGSFLIPIANFKSIKKLCGLEKTLKTGKLENAAETVSDEFILLAHALIDSIENEDIKKSVEQTLKNIDKIETETKEQYETKNDEIDTYSLSTVSITTLANVVHTHHLTEEEAAAMPNAFKLNSSEESRTLQSDDGIDKTIYLNQQANYSNSEIISDSSSCSSSSD